LLEAEECPFCMGPMESEYRAGREWLVCPNGCATEYEAPERKPVAAEVASDSSESRAAAHRAGS
jgi:hypothetical protein